jgi:hypothetical protein
MRKNLSALVLLASLMACNDAVTTQVNRDKPTPETKQSEGATAAPVDSAAMMQACTNFMQTGPMHQLLAKDNGTWTESITMWMAPGAPPSSWTATSTYSMALGGRYQQAKHTGTFDGMPFEGMSTTGYDNARKKFINTWIDNMGTGIIYLEGDWDSTASTIHYSGMQTDPVSAKQVKIRQDVTYNPDGSQIITMYGPPMGGGKNYKMMEIVAKKKG